MRGSPTAPDAYELFCAAGQISHDACSIWRALAEDGPLATLELRHICKMDSKAGNVRFKRAMLELQCLLAVVHFGAELETAAWASARFELTSRAFPEQARLARRIMPEQARAAIAAKYLERHADAPCHTLARLFGWTRAETMEATEAQRHQGMH